MKQKDLNKAMYEKGQEFGRKERETEIIEIIDKWYEDDEEISYYQYEDLIKKIKEQKEQ